MVVTMCTFAFMYLTVTNEIAIKGYKIQELENKVIELKTENQKLQIQTTQFQSLQNIEQQAKNLGMVPVDHVEYLASIDSIVAQK